MEGPSPFIFLLKIHSALSHFSHHLTLSLPVTSANAGNLHHDPRHSHKGHRFPKLQDSQRDNTVAHAFFPTANPSRAPNTRAWWLTPSGVTTCPSIKPRVGVGCAGFGFFVSNNPDRVSTAYSRICRLFGTSARKSLHLFFSLALFSCSLFFFFFLFYRLVRWLFRYLTPP